MYISNLTDNTEKNFKTLEASSLEDVELLNSIAKLLYNTKSVRKVIEIIDNINLNHE